MASNSATNLFLIFFIITQCLSVLNAAKDFDFFYFVQQWPGSYCDTKQSCCYPTTGKPAADFGIHGLWPNNNDGTYPSNCDPSSPYDQSQISDLISRMQQTWPTLACPSGTGSTFWSHEWEKHGTCAESVLTNQHAYFKKALDLKNQIDLLAILQGADIHPDGGSYDLDNIRSAINSAIGYTPWIQCNVDESDHKIWLEVAERRQALILDYIEEYVDKDSDEVSQGCGKDASEGVCEDDEALSLPHCARHIFYERLCTLTSSPLSMK